MSEEFDTSSLGKPLYEYEQVVTSDDLFIIYTGLSAQYKASRWWERQRRRDLQVAGHAIYELLAWIRDGKPALREQGE